MGRGSRKGLKGTTPREALLVPEGLCSTMLTLLSSSAAVSLDLQSNEQRNNKFDLFLTSKETKQRNCMVLFESILTNN
jgi:hypothetical protein